MKNYLIGFLLFALITDSTMAQDLVAPSGKSVGVKPISDDQGKEVKRDYYLNWTGIKAYQTLDERQVNQVHFSGARVREASFAPYFAKSISLGKNVESVSAHIQDIVVEELSDAEAKLVMPYVKDREFGVSTMVGHSANSSYASISVFPLRKSGNRIERLVAFNLKIIEQRGGSRGDRGSHSWKESSVLIASTWYKLSTAKDGIYKVTYKWMRDAGFNMDNLSSNAIKVYGTGAGTLSKANEDKRPDDLTQLSIQVVDGGDGRFDLGDYFLFYGEDQITWKHQNNGRFRHDLNPYSDSTYYFLTVDSEINPPTRVSEGSGVNGAAIPVTTYNYHEVHESDEVNLIKSGRKWFGEQLGVVPELDFGFSIPGIDRQSPLNVYSTFVGRSPNANGTSMRMSLPGNGSESETFEFNSVGTFYGAPFGREGDLILEVMPNTGNVLVKMSFNNSANAQAQAWVDYIEVNARRELSLIGNELFFRDYNSVSSASKIEFQIKASEEISVWDVTDLSDVKAMKLSGDAVAGFRFKADGSKLREYVAFTEDAFLQPTKVGWVENQNLHAISNVEYIIVAYSSFKAQAQRLAELHESIDGLTSVVVTPGQIYNEFSGGAQDITAIKEFVRMLYHNADSTGGLKPRYLLLFGDASYDYKDKTSGNSNLVPTYQMENSLTPTGSIASDDFFGLLDDDEGQGNLDMLDIGVGRIPARNKKEAEDVVNKIVYYVSNNATLGEWRNWIAYVADDADPGDGFSFMQDSDDLSELVEANAPSYNVQKLYMDAYKQESGSGGERYPDGAEAIDERVSKGALLMYYIGHGGELGWSHERILEVATVNKWENLNGLPLFITATCEFGRFDDPRRTSAGEYVLLNPSGGGSALLTTTRAVYSSPNLTLTTEFTSVAFQPINGEMPRLGDIMVQTKVRTIDTNSSAALNSRSFALLGDPAMRLAYPQYNVVVTNAPDTMKALEKVKIEGFVADANGSILSDFNGVVYPTIFDKKAQQQTLNNDGIGVYEYEELKNMIFKGKSSVVNGRFSCEFVVPKDINRAYDNGKLSFYAHNGSDDAAGQYSEHTVGGLSDNPVIDNEGPETELFMNNIKFVFGGLTNENPDLYAELWDQNGINMVGSGIGHDITAVLDNNTSRTLVLNDYYEADLDSYQSGKVRYPFSDLEEGKHTLKMQVWDVNNNPSDAYTEFVVANDEELVLEHVLNYPNPFTTNTDFYFEHNKPGQVLSVDIEIFTVSGKLVKTIRGEYLSDGFRLGPINWNGRDRYEDILAKGVYLYRIKVRTPNGETAEKFERIVLLK